MTKMPLPLQANETRKATRKDGQTVEQMWIAGGMFCYVVLRDAGGRLVWSHSYQFEVNATAKYAELVNA